MRYRFIGALTVIIAAGELPPMNYLLSALPILLVLALMVFARWGGQRAGPAGWLAGVLVAALAFGLNMPVFWVSQVKGLFLSIFVLLILWPALLLYNVVDQTGGVRAIALGLERWVGERGLLLVVLAWAFSGLLEGLAGFGLPIAIVAPMLAGLGVPAVRAVAAVAVGHAWSVTFGDMSVVFQTLAAIVDRPQSDLAPLAALFLGAACIACGVGAALILKQPRKLPVVVVLGLLMAAVQYALAVSPLVPLSVFGAGLAGVLGAVVYTRLHKKGIGEGEGEVVDTGQPTGAVETRTLIAGLGSYLFLGLVLGVLFLTPELYERLSQVAWQAHFPAVSTDAGSMVPAAAGQAIRPLVQPGVVILLVALLSAAVFRITGILGAEKLPAALAKTWRAAAPVSVGIIAMVGLATLMEHTGMTFLLAQGLSRGLGSLFPLVSPLVGVLGAFATGSNNNSNVLFAPLQDSAAVLLSIDPRLLLATQTTGGALGSMIAPAKIIVGCSTVGLWNREGDVLKVTIPYCIAICLGLGVLALVMA